MGFSHIYFWKMKGLLFYKLFGSGTGEGFTPVLNPNVYAIMSVWETEEIADKSILTSTIYNKYKKRSEENWTLYLRPTRSWGSWDKNNPFKAEPNQKQTYPVVALTRATIKTKILFKFWQRVPDISDRIGSNSKVLFKIGLGEIPWFHQVTFSIWPNQESMDQFARKDGPHSHAIEAVRKNNWFKEELYARFSIDKELGKWPDNKIQILDNK
jgi:spheroidene monooxygenase